MGVGIGFNLFGDFGVILYDFNIKFSIFPYLLSQFFRNFDFFSNIPVI